MSLDKCIDLCNHNHNQDTKHFPNLESSLEPHPSQSSLSPALGNHWSASCYCRLDLLFFFCFFFSFIFISWRLITLQYCSGFCHTLTWISHGFTCIPRPDPPFPPPSQVTEYMVFCVEHDTEIQPCFCIKNPFLITKKCSLVWIYHNLPIHIPTDGLP